MVSMKVVKTRAIVRQACKLAVRAQELRDLIPPEIVAHAQYVACALVGSCKYSEQFLEPSLIQKAKEAAYKMVPDHKEGLDQS